MITKFQHRQHLFSSVSNRFCEKVKEALASLKERLIARYELLSPNQGAAIRDALNQAEEQAWNTAFPQLLFPDLAEIKLATVVADRRPTFKRVP